MSTCSMQRMLWVPGFAKMEPGDFLPGSDAGLVTYGMIESMKSGLLGEERRSLVRAGRYLRIDCGGRCSSCLFKAVMAKTGAMLNESQYSGDVAFLTLTYRPDVPGGDRRADMADKVLMPPHIRTFRERLRRDSHYGKFRSLVVGEYGDLRGRAHWHAILWSEAGESLPEFPHDERFLFKHWPHGHCFARPNPGQEAFQYVAGYALKSLLTADVSGPRPSQLYITASRRPVLGHRVFREVAERAAEYAVPPSFNYLPPGGNRKYHYTMKDRARDLYVDAYLDRLALVAPDDATFSALSLPLTQMPQGIAFRGAAFDGGPDLWMHKAILEGLARREARLNPVPPAVSAEADMAEMVADLRDKQSRQARINRLQEEKRLADDLRRSNERRKRLDAERRVAAEVQRLKEWAERLNPPVLHDPADPFEEDAALWDDFSADRFSVDLLRSGAWRWD